MRACSYFILVKTSLTFFIFFFPFFLVMKKKQMGKVEQVIMTKLTEAYKPLHIEVMNEVRIACSSSSARTMQIPVKYEKASRYLQRYTILLRTTTAAFVTQQQQSPARQYATCSVQQAALTIYDASLPATFLRPITGGPFHTFSG